MHPSAGLFPPETQRGIGSSPRRSRAASLALFIALVLATGWVARELLFVTFRLPDDEGYFLLALRARRAGAALYDDVDTVYGPFYFQLADVLSRVLHAPFDNVSARWFVLVLWIGAGVCVALYVARVTRSLSAAALAYFLSWFLMRELAGIPPHPTALVVGLLALLALATLGISDPARSGRAFFACGALTAALALTKLNAGVYALLAFALCFAEFAPRTRAAAALHALLAVLAVLFPFLLMQPLLGDPRVQELACTVSLSLAPLVLLRAPDSESRSPPRIGLYLGGGAVVTLLVLGVCVVQGTHPVALWRSLVLGTLHFPGAFVVPPRIERGVEILVAGAALPMFLLARSPRTPGARADRRILLKLAGGVAILALCLSSAAECLRALPLVWLVAVDGTSARRASDSRVLLALLVVFEALHGYPIAGSQAVPFAFLVPIIGLVTVIDAWRELPERWRSPFAHASWRRSFAAAALLALAWFHALRTNAPILARQISKSIPSELPGAQSVRMYERRAAECQWATANVRRNGATLFTAPGMHSFNVWSSLGTPVAFYPNTWILFYDARQEEELARALTASERPCVLRDSALIEFWTGRRELRDGALSRVLEREFVTVAAVGDLELMLPSSAHADLVLSVFDERAPPGVRERFGIDRVLRLSFPVLDGASVQRITVVDTLRNAVVADSSADAAELRACVVDADGECLLRAGSSGAIDLSRERPVFLITPERKLTFDARWNLVRAYDASGKVVARLLAPTHVQAR
jgi:hypothetical protein